MKTRLFSLLLMLIVYNPSIAHAAEVRVAVASNFRLAMSSLIDVFEANSAHQVIPSYGSTGRQYAQIINGAPYDLFFAADVARPALLEQQGLIVNDSRYTYAIGKLVLWRRDEADLDLRAQSLLNDNVRHISLANPTLAPYGKAAEQVIDALHFGERLSGKLVHGENIAQAFQFVDSGNAQLGFVAYSQIINRDIVDKESVWFIPQNLYGPIEQQAVLIKETIASSEFYAFLHSDSARKIIRQAGYETL